ncbi:MAG: DUF1122 family protein [Thermoplasmatota archaeon]
MHTNDLMLKNLIDDLKEGKKINRYILKAKNEEEGRLKGQHYLPIHLLREKKNKRLLYMSIYLGNEPYYRGWVELFGINHQLFFEGNKINYFGSDIEGKLIRMISSHSIGGEKIFIEYQGDNKTISDLSMAFPEPVSRLGYLLFQNGYTWFKDWYFAEGYNEGGQKLQGEKPLDEGYRKKHIKDIKDRVEEFISINKGIGEDNQELKRAILRGKKILDDVKGDIES